MLTGSDGKPPGSPSTNETSTTSIYLRPTSCEIQDAHRRQAKWHCITTYFVPGFYSDFNFPADHRMLLADMLSEETLRYFDRFLDGVGGAVTHFPVELRHCSKGKTRVNKKNRSLNK